MMNETRTLIKSKLKQIHPRVSFLRASDSSSFPYVVYDIEITDLEDGVKLLTLDVDVFDANPDTTEIEAIMKQVHESFNRQTFITEKMVVSFYSDRILAVVEDNNSVMRRKNIYLGRLFER